MSVLWTPDLAVGDLTIDAQHQELFRRVNGLLEAMKRGDGTSAVAGVLSFLEVYVVKHFTAEEAAMRATCYPGFRMHQAEHKAFVQTFQGLKKEMESDGPSVTLLLQVNEQVCVWLRKHIIGTDQAFGRFLATRDT